MLYFREEVVWGSWSCNVKMRECPIFKRKEAQTTVEYLLLLTTVVTIVLVGIRVYLPRFQETSNIYFNRVAVGIMGNPPRCGDGECRPEPFESCEKCPTDCGSCGSG